MQIRPGLQAYVVWALQCARAHSFLKFGTRAHLVDGKRGHGLGDEAGVLLESLSKRALVGDHLDDVDHLRLGQLGLGAKLDAGGLQQKKCVFEIKAHAR